MSDASATPESADEPVRLREGVGFSLTVFLVARVAVSLTAVLAVTTHGPDPSALAPGAPPPAFTQAATPGWHNAWDGLDRWDAPWFRWIATDGYGTGDDNRPAFLPGYPVMIRLLAPAADGDERLAALAVANVSYAVALVILFGLTAHELGRARARRAVAFFAAMPASFFFLAPYSEAPYLLATLLAFWWSRGRRPLLAGLAGASAVLLRILGVALVPSLALLWLRRRDRPRAVGIGVVLAPLAALAAYGAWWALSHGDALAPVRAQAYWHREPSFPVVTLVRGVGLAMNAAIQRTAPWLVTDAVIVMLVLITAVWMIRRIPAPYTAYTWTVLLVPLATAPGFRPLDAMPRLTCVLFPLAWTWVVGVRARSTIIAIIAVLAACQLALAAVFMNWGWIF